MRAPDKLQALRELRARDVPIATIIDVGVLASTDELIQVFPDKHHVLFEPVQEFADSIRKNYARIDHTLVTAAVSDREGETTLRVHSVVRGMAISHSGIVAGEVDSADKRTVPAVTLDGYLSRHPRPAPYFVKLDVDGYEIPIMRGATETLSRASVVMIETPRHQLVERIAFLQSHGFELFDLVAPCYYDKVLWQCDAIMIKHQVQVEHFAQLKQGFRPEKYETFKI